MKPVALPYPDVLNTLGDHIRTKRLDLGLRQKDVAKLLGADKMTVNYWETNRNQPSLHMVPRIIDFLGYTPNLEEQTSETLGQRIVRIRRALGVRQKDLAREIGVDPTTLARWEREESAPAPEYQRLLSEFLMMAGSFDEVQPGRGGGFRDGRPRN